MKVTSTNFSGLKIVQSKIYRDNRGLLKEIFKQKIFKNDDFIFNIVSSSKKQWDILYNKNYFRIVDEIQNII